MFTKPSNVSDMEGAQEGGMTDDTISSDGEIRGQKEKTMMRPFTAKWAVIHGGYCSLVTEAL